MSQSSQSPELLPTIIGNLQERLERLPTDEEVYTFIFGSQAERDAIWNQETKS